MRDEPITRADLIGVPLMICFIACFVGIFIAVGYEAWITAVLLTIGAWFFTLVLQEV